MTEENMDVLFARLKKITIKDIFDNPALEECLFQGIEKAFILPSNPLNPLTIKRYWEVEDKATVEKFGLYVAEFDVWCFPYLTVEEYQGLLAQDNAEIAAQAELAKAASQLLIDHGEPPIQSESPPPPLSKRRKDLEAVLTRLG